MNKLGTPWDFANKYTSPDRLLTLDFGYVGEIAMGAPLSGECFLKIQGKRFKLDGMFGGPIVWNESSKKAAIPYWTRNRLQKLAIIDINEMKILISKKEFRVIELSKYENELVYGIDSPIHQTEKIEFNVQTEKYSKKIEIIDYDYI